MIRKVDILDRASEWHLRPEIVEKDYVLGWLLAALGSLKDIRPLWIFKGGTCLKKCILETYRFSEDLDFSLLPDAPYAQEDIHSVLQSTASRATDLSGLDVPADRVVVNLTKNRQGQPTYEGRIYYRGPLGRRDYARVLLDVTNAERVIDTPTPRTIFHSYPDELPPDTTVLSYSSNELLAEKLRALAERTRPRDLYDVVYLLENAAEGFNLDEVRRIFPEKCRHKGLTPPTASDIVHTAAGAEELRSEWANMLAHQLPVLPDLDAILQRLPDLLVWLEEPTALPAVLGLPMIGAMAGGAPLAAPGIRYWGGGSVIEQLRFAGSNRLIVEFVYHGRRRTLEPYSLRRPATGNLLLYGWDPGSQGIRSFKIDEIQNFTVTTTAFTPRFRVEFSRPPAP
jgi:predicted nucleotidyltransferase component of viral defense system